MNHHNWNAKALPVSIPPMMANRQPFFADNKYQTLQIDETLSGGNPKQAIMSYAGELISSFRSALLADERDPAYQSIFRVNSNVLRGYFDSAPIINTSNIPQHKAQCFEKAMI